MIVKQIVLIKHHKPNQFVTGVIVEIEPELQRVQPNHIMISAVSHNSSVWYSRDRVSKLPEWLCQLIDNLTEQQFESWLLSQSNFKCDPSKRNQQPLAQFVKHQCKTLKLPIQLKKSPYIWTCGEVILDTVAGDQVVTYKISAPCLSKRLTTMHHAIYLSDKHLNQQDVIAYWTNSYSAILRKLIDKTCLSL